MWDAIEVLEFKRKHTGNVTDSLDQIRRMIDGLTAKRDARRDGFNRTIIQAMETSLGATVDDATNALVKEGLAKDAVTKALQRLGLEGKPFTLWNLVDALTHENVSLSNAGDRLEADAKIAKLLTLAL